MEPAVTFNVGGTPFTTVRETLLKEASSRLALIARGAVPALRDPSGVYFIDRDPKYFQMILNFLRDGWCLVPPSVEQRRELLQEVRYYQLNGFELWLRAQELLGEGAAAAASGLGGPDYLSTESPRNRTHYMAQPLGSPAPPLASTSFPSSATSPGAIGGRPLAGGAGAGGPHSPFGGGGSHTTTGLAAAPPPHLRSPYGVGAGGTGSLGTATGGTGGGGGAGPASYQPGVVASLRDAFLTATGPQRPAAHMPAYSLPEAAEDGGSWTSKYLRHNEGLRGITNTLLELAYVPPHRALHGGRIQLTIRMACDHDRPSSLVGPQQDHVRSKLMEVRVVGATGWTFEFTVRPSSDPALWDKYSPVAAGVQDQYFVLGAILKDCFGIVLEEDSAARPTCAACRRTNLAIALTRIY